MPATIPNLTGFAFNAFQPVSVAQDHQGNIYIANGINKVQLYNGVRNLRDAEVEQADQYNGTTLSTAAGSGSGSINGTYYWALRFVDMDGNPCNLTQVSSFAATSAATVTYSNLDTADGAYTGSYEVYRSLAGDPSVLYLDAVGATTSTKTDAQLARSTELPILNADGTLHARRFTRPPHDKAVLVWFKDRMWAAVDVFYSEGHIVGDFSAPEDDTITAADNTTPIKITSATAPSATGDGVVVAGVLGNTAANGTWTITRIDATHFFLDGSEGNGTYVSGGTWETGDLGSSMQFGRGNGATAATLNGEFVGRSLWIRNFADRFSVTETVNSGGASNIYAVAAIGTGSPGDFTKYVITPDFERMEVIYYSELLEPLSWPQDQNQVALSDNLGDRTTGLMPHGNYLYILKERHIYRLSYSTVPAVDGEVQLVASRGCVNQRCWVQVEDVAYLMDEQGIYAFNGASVQPLSQPIQDYFRGNRITWANSKWFHACHNPAEETISWFVCLGGTYLPRHALVYNYRLNAWAIDSFHFGVGASCLGEINGQLVPLYCGQNFRIVTPAGSLDGVADGDDSLRGTVSSATLMTLSDSSKTFPSSVRDASLVIVSGRGKGQRRNVCTVSSSKLTIDYPWSIQPDTTSVYQIGGIPWRMRLGKFNWPALEQQQKRTVTTYFAPTDNAASMDFRVYQSYRVNPTKWRGDRTIGLLTTTDNDPDQVIDLKHQRTEGGDTYDNYSPGYEKVDLGESHDQRIPGDRSVSFEWRGVQGQDRISIGKIEIEGVK